MRVWRPWLLGWVGMAALAIVNGAFRALVTQPWIGEEAARRVACFTLLAMLFVYVRWLYRRRPLPSAETAWAVGLAWVAMTVTFEFSWGRWVEGLSWSTILADYDLTRGRLWLLVLVGAAVMPRVVHALAGRARDPVTGGRARSSAR